MEFLAADLPELSSLELYPRLMRIAASDFDESQDEGLTSSVGQQNKRKRFTRSKAGCLVCRKRKVKCDETRPACLRCDNESRKCSYQEGDISSSPGRQSDGYAHRNTRPRTPAIDSTPIASSSRQGSSYDHHQQHLHSQQQIIPLEESQARMTGINEPTQYDDWLAFLFGTSTQDTIQSDLYASISEWMSNGILIPEASTTMSTPFTQFGRDHLPFDAARDGPGSARYNALSEQQRKIADSSLQQRLRGLCTSDVQLEAVSQCECHLSDYPDDAHTLLMHSSPAVFNFVAQCFHLLTAEVNSWRRVYAELSCQSSLTLNLVTCVGLISVSLIGPVNRRSLAYALLTKSISEWQAIVNIGREGPISQLTQLQVLEVIAGAILIGHVEQFDTGLAVHTIGCMKETRRVVDAVVEGRNCNVDLGQGSHFRFLIRAFLWWDTLSRTMGCGSGGYYPKSAFDLVRQWEEDEGEETIKTSQCVLVGHWTYSKQSPELKRLPITWKQIMVFTLLLLEQR